MSHTADNGAGEVYTLPEIWETPFGDPQLKVERAKTHIADLQERIGRSPDAYTLSVYTDPNTGKQFLCYELTDKSIRSDIALMTGDAIHNLKGALDLAWCEAFRTLHPAVFDPRFAKFPVYSTRRDLETALSNKVRIIPSDSLFDFVVERVRSYEGGDSDVWAIHRLDLHEKHRILIPVLDVISLDGVEWEREDGRIDLLTFDFTRNLSCRVEVPHRGKIKNHGQLVTRVTFRNGTPAEGLGVAPTLFRFYLKTRAIVRKLQRMTVAVVGQECQFGSEGFSSNPK
jgi:hypothetical protein